MVTVAQLVEHWIVIPVVVGSSPISHPTFSRFKYYAKADTLCIIASFVIPCFGLLPGVHLL